MEMSLLAKESWEKIGLVFALICIFGGAIYALLGTTKRREEDAKRAFREMKAKKEGT